MVSALAQASLVLGVIFVIPLTFWVIFFVGPVWFLVVSIVGIRSALARGSGRPPAPATT